MDLSFGTIVISAIGLLILAALLSGPA